VPKWDGKGERWRGGVGARLHLRNFGEWHVPMPVLTSSLLYTLRAFHIRVSVQNIRLAVIVYISTFLDAELDRDDIKDLRS
jgi:hypothetical protein